MHKAWWQGKVAYQIYPRSFKDSNGDGIGDLRGTIEKLPYIASLGVEILYLNPIFASPGADNGYDISDYRKINPQVGTLADLDELIARAKERGISIILDMVLSYTSCEHELFKRALLGRKAPERDFYYFVRGSNGRPPDNLRSFFGGSVWERVPGEEDLYYLHYFTKEQPELNWYNERLRERMSDLINWWLDRGIAGFRLDAIMNVVKDRTFPGLPPDELGDGSCAAARMNAKLAAQAPSLYQELKKHSYGPRGAFTVAEAFGLNDNLLDQFIGDEGCFSTVFDFTARETIEKNRPGYYAYPKGTLKIYRDGNFHMQQLTSPLGLVAPILENHDEPRAVSFYLEEGQQNAQGARALGTVFMFLRGIPFIYQGQELGLTNTHFDSIEEIDDVQSKNEYRNATAHGFTKEQALAILNVHSRDHARTPLPWDDSPHAGFTTGRPWLKLHQDALSLNVAAQEQDPGSVLNYYRALVALRKRGAWQECFCSGDFIPGSTADDHVMHYLRKGAGKCAEIVGNFSTKERVFELSGEGRILLCSIPEARVEGRRLTLGATGAAVVEILPGRSS